MSILKGCKPKSGAAARFSYLLPFFFQTAVDFSFLSGVDTWKICRY